MPWFHYKSDSTLFRLVLFAVLVHSSQECASNIGGTCYSGISYADMQSNVGFETCAEDLLKDWCVAKYEQDPINGGRFNYSCASSYHSSLLSLQCGDTISNINNRGCYKALSANGNMCFYCCCKGNRCNSPKQFYDDVMQFLGYSTNDAPKILFTNEILSLLLITIILFLKLLFE